MNTGAQGPARSFSLTALAVWFLVAAGPLPSAVVAQATAQPADGGRGEVRAAAVEDRLWLARVQGGRCVLSHRGPGSPFEVGEPFNATIVSLTAVGREAYVFCADGAFYRYSEGWSRAVDLPGRQRAGHMVGVDGVLYALVPSQVAAQLPLREPGQAAPTSLPFDPGAAPLSIARYDSRGWSAVAACPPIVPAGAPAGQTPRLGHAHACLILFWLAREPPQISYLWFDLSTGRWLSGGSVGLPRVSAYWAPTVNRIPTLVVAVTRDDGSAELVAYQLLGSGPAGGDTWQPTQVELSPLPDDAGQVRYRDAFGFNQHLGVLAIGPDGPAYVRFGRFGGPSAMDTIDAFAQEPPPPPATGFQTVRAVVVLGVLAALLVFRRGSVVTPIELPKGRAAAFTLQRLAGAAIDLVPFAAAAGLILRIDAANALEQMVRWAFDAKMNNTGLPDAPLLLWWSLSAGGYTLYSLTMELATRRTIGKVLLRVELLSDSGSPPAVSQIVVRNLFRFMEVMPPFWIFGLLVVLSRNRQRIGDIFARTVAVRRVGSPAEDKDSAES